jgi:hypothetical protein
MTRGAGGEQTERKDPMKGRFFEEKRQCRSIPFVKKDCRGEEKRKVL